jgi:hypothetical protein
MPVANSVVITSVARLIMAIIEFSSLRRRLAW